MVLVQTDIPGKLSHPSCETLKLKTKSCHYVILFMDSHHCLKAEYIHEGKCTVVFPEETKGYGLVKLTHVAFYSLVYLKRIIKSDVTGSVELWRYRSVFFSPREIGSFIPASIHDWVMDNNFFSSQENIVCEVYI